MKIVSLFIVLVSLFSYSLFGQSNFPPSQRALNGFLLGEDAKPVAEGFDSLLKEQKYSDNWTDRVYALDTTGSAYMVFGFADSSDDCQSIQITGSAGTPMHPFLGLTLGDSREKVLEALGSPSQIRHLQARGMQFLQYSNRNYSVELDSLDRLCSIRITGYEGFRNNPPDSLPNLESMFQALRSNNPDLILETLAPDVEVVANDTVFSFVGSPLDVISDPSTTLSQFLYSEDLSLASVNQSQIRAAILDPESVKKNNQMPRFSFPGGSPVKDVVFVVHAGKWRMWEIHFSR